VEWPLTLCRWSLINLTGTDRGFYSSFLCSVLTSWPVITAGSQLPQHLHTVFLWWCDRYYLTAENTYGSVHALLGHNMSSSLCKSAPSQKEKTHVLDGTCDTLFSSIQGRSSGQTDWTKTNRNVCFLGRCNSIQWLSITKILRHHTRIYLLITNIKSR